MFKAGIDLGQSLPNDGKESGPGVDYLTIAREKGSELTTSI